MKIGIIDYQGGNINNIYRAINRIGYEGIIIKDRESLKNVDIMLLPGVGNFGEAMNFLNETGIAEGIKEEFERGKGLIGICLGLQLATELSEESEGLRGLGILPGRTKKLPRNILPNIGWNEIRSKDSKYNNKLGYFVHSYYVETDNKYVLAESEYKEFRFPAIVKKEHFVGTQFHPERSGEEGHEILRNLIEVLL